VTAGVVALAGIAGYKAGEWIGQKTFDDFASNSTYLSLEKEKYGDELGSAWKRNTRILGMAEIIGGVATFAVFGAPRVAIGLGVAGVATYLGAPIAYKFGQHSAEAELERESELGRRIEAEWKNAERNR
jgi:hypothetical protein